MHNKETLTKLIIFVLSRKRGCATYVGILTRTRKSQFLRIHNSLLSDGCQSCCEGCHLLKETAYQIWRKLRKPFPRYEWVNFNMGFFLFKITRTRKCTPIGLKSGHPEAIIYTNLSENSYKILRVIIDYLHETRIIFRHAYRVYRWLDQPENQHVARFNIRGVPFWW